MSELRVLVIGGYGVFGGRTVLLLKSNPLLTIIIAGRSAAKATAFAASQGNVAGSIEGVAFDRESDVVTQIAALNVDLVIDASGPFQAYGALRYRVVEACIELGVHYLDLADGSEFVEGIAQFDEAARAKGLFVLSGVSSFPVLTAAVVRSLASDMVRIRRIVGGIAPSPFAGVGENVIRAIASYAGQPVEVRSAGRRTTKYPFTEHRRVTIGPPGLVPLQSKLFSLVDVPDLRVLAQAYPDAEEVWMGAGPVPEILHRGLAALAWLVRLRLAPSLSPLAPLMHWAMNHLRWGEHRGGMFVEVTGLDSNHVEIVRSWHMLAEGDDGPLVPSMAIAAIIQNVSEGAPPPAGARAALADLQLSDYQRMFAGRSIQTGGRVHELGRSIYARVLGDSFHSLPLPIRAMHDRTGLTFARGTASVRRGEGWIAKLITTVIGFPETGDQVPVQVEFCVEPGMETWKRTFGERSFYSRQFAGSGRSEGLLCEQFGPLTFAMALVVDNESLSLVTRRWSVFGLPLPLWFCPRSRAFETVRDGLFHFHIDISHPWTGHIVSYAGALHPPE